MLELTRRPAFRLAYLGALIAAAGILLSGPLSMVLTTLLAPQPPWRDPALLSAHFHPLQLAAYVFGFPLIGGFVVLHAALVGAADERTRPYAITGLAFATVFATLITFNYIAQLAIVPALRDDPASASLVTALTMVNPRSVGWFLEMFGYGVLGVASMVVTPCFRGGRLEQAAVALLWANGVLSVVGAVATAAWPAWVLAPAGLAAYALWNVVVLAMVVVLALVFRRHR